MEVNERNFEKIFNFEDRLVRFAGECILFVRKLEKSYEVDYYKNQLIRSSGSSSLNYGEAQAAESRVDFIHKTKICLKYDKTIRLVE